MGPEGREGGGGESRTRTEETAPPCSAVYCCSAQRTAVHCSAVRGGAVAVVWCGGLLCCGVLCLVANGLYADGPMAKRAEVGVCNTFCLAFGRQPQPLRRDSF